MPLLPEAPEPPERPVLGLLLVPPVDPPPLRAPFEPAPTLAEPPGSRFAKLWEPLAKPPLLEAAVPLPVPAAWPEAALVTPDAPPGDLLLAALPPPVPEAWADVA
jgi:hypothetical protein